MSIWTLGEGGYIKVTFDQSLVGTVANNGQHFIVSWQENEYAPNGPVTVSKSFSPESTGLGESDTNLILTMASTQQFNNAAVEIAHGQPGSEVIIDDAANGLALNNLTIGIALVQEGSGTPSPTNIRPISGWTGATIFRSGANPSDPEEIAVSWVDQAGTVYGGILDVTSGVMTENVYLHAFDGTETLLANGYGDSRYFAYVAGTEDLGDRSTAPYSGFSHLGTRQPTTGNTGAGANVYYSSSTTPGQTRIAFRFPSNMGLTTQEAMRDYLAEQYANGTPFQAWFRLKPRYAVTYQLTPQQVATLSGTNHIWANTGDILSLDYWRQTPIRVQYDGLGTLRGLGGPVEAFDETFVPVGLIPKPSQKVAEHVEISNITFNGQLMAVDYIEGKAAEHIEISNITFNGALIDVGDL